MEVHPDAGLGPVSSRCPSGASTDVRPDPPFAGRAPKLASALFIASVLLWNPLRSHGADPPANAPTDQQLGAALQAAERLLEMGRGEEALTLIRPVAEARPDSQQAAFTTGLAALAAADVAVGEGVKHTDSGVKENYNLAVRAFRGMLVADPSQLRVRLELARALFSRGNCIQPPSNLFKHLLGDDCWAAEQHFIRVLGADVPPQVALNVRRFIQICRARKRATGSLSLALAPDTNVNTSTSSRRR